MDEVLSFLESEISNTQQAINAATIKLNTLQDLLRKYQESHLQSNHSKPVPIRTEQPHVSMDPATFTRDDDNKTQLVLDVILKHQSEGVKAGHVYDEIISKGTSINRNYVYSILNRQKKRGTIQHKRGKYYPTLSAFASTATGGTSSAV
jgi:hypothetical protein